MTPATSAALARFVELSQAALDRYMVRFPNCGRKTLSVEPGHKYARIVVTDSQRSVYCFVDMTTGDILKSESWKKPSKSGRGNIFTIEAVSDVSSLPFG